MGEADISILRQFIGYDPNTGKFWWKLSPKKTIPAGQEAGIPHKPSGYIQVKFRGKMYSGAKLAWALHYGAWPRRVNSRNGDRGDLRIQNLYQPPPARRDRSKTNPVCGHVEFCSIMGEWKILYARDQKLHLAGYAKTKGEALKRLNQIINPSQKAA